MLRRMIACAFGMCLFPAQAQLVQDCKLESNPLFSERLNQTKPAPEVAQFLAISTKLRNGEAVTYRKDDAVVVADVRVVRSAPAVVPNVPIRLRNSWLLSPSFNFAEGRPLQYFNELKLPDGRTFAVLWLSDDSVLFIDSEGRFANLCAFRLDLRLDGLAHAFGARYTRYADDIVLSGGIHLSDVMPRIKSWVGRIAFEEGFALNHRKTRRLTAGRRQSVCSVVVNQHPNLPRPEFDRLKAILHQCVKKGPASQNRDANPHWREYLHGRVAWAAQLNPAKAERLKRLLEQVDWSR